MFIFTPASQAETITGKVVGVAGGDTITVLQNKTQYKIRLWGIDCPEKHQAFGQKAKQFTADMVFGKEVEVHVDTQDRYGRSVGIVYVGETCVNAEIIKAGFAWVYTKYCKQPICDKWLGIEEAARTEKVGLWVENNPEPPWEFRRAGK